MRRRSKEERLGREGWGMEILEDRGEIRISEEEAEMMFGLIQGQEWERNQKAERGKNGGQFFEKLMSVEEVADALRIAPQTLRNWVALRQVPFIRLGGKTRFRWRSVEAWLERKEFQRWQ